MEMKDYLESISKRGNGSIQLGVVGAVRTGKSTFIKKVIENMVVPNIVDEYDKKKCLDEIPQSSNGKQIMTTEPKFVPSSGAVINMGDFTTNIKLIDWKWPSTESMLLLSNQHLSPIKETQRAVLDVSS